MKAHAERLERALGASHRLAARLDEPGYPLAELEMLQAWQRRRLAVTYDDLISRPRYQPAGEFFLNELYGGLHFRERDQEVERVLPVMLRTMRGDMLDSMAEAFELQSLSLELDMAMVEVLAARNWGDLDVDRYGEAYRASGRLEERARQIELIRHLGLKLNELVHHRVVLMLVRLLRGPARAAGFGRLQGFLEEGLYAFRHMRDGTEFVLTIWQRETDARQRLIAADPDPFDGAPPPDR